MKLYFSSGACSLASHICLEETGMAYEAEMVDMKAKTCQAGDFTKINSKGLVPALKMDSGEILTEGAIIMQYIADQKPESNLFGKFGTTERYRTMEAVNYIATEIHKTYNSIFVADRLFAEGIRDQVKTTMRDVLTKKFDWLDAQLNGKEWLVGKSFSAADAYLFTCWNWNQWVGVDGSKWKNLSAHATRTYARPAVQRAMKAEGLLK